MHIVKDITPFVGRQKIYRLLGQNNSGVSERLAGKIDRCIDQLKKKIRPKVLFTTRKVQKTDNNTLTLEGGISLKSAKLSKTLGKCDRVTFFLTTIGGEIDNLINTLLRRKKISDAYIYDAIASAAVEETVDEFQKRVDATVQEKNLSTTLRFSPGYCDWMIEDQKKIFSVLKNDLIGVDLNENCLMTPRKSVSGVFGIGKRSKINRKETNPCRMCGKKDCIARREE
jgi:hypothetical protein